MLVKDGGKMKNLKIASIPGDGIGIEVVPAAIKV
jgi:isocitrate/isopropylmalate dehydrogenase